MVRTRPSSRVVALFVLCILTGCQSPERMALTPLAPEATPTFGELIQRSKSQMTAAHEAYYSDNWKEMERCTAAIKETGLFLTRLQVVNASDVQKAKLASLIKDYNEAADQLKVVGTAKDPIKTNQVLQRLNEVYYQLRVEQLTVAPAPISGPDVTTPATNPTGTVPPAK